MKKIYIISAFFYLGLLSFNGVRAQQDPNRTLYRYTMNLANPAYAGAAMGLEGTGTGPVYELGIDIRSQWLSVEGAPETQSVFFGTQVGRNLGLGVSVINDKTFIEKSTSVNIDVSYKVRLSDVTDLYFGIKAGANSYNANLSGLNTYGVAADPSLTSVDGRFKPNVGVGALIKGQRYFVSVSAPGILSNDRLEQENGSATYAASRPHIYLSGGYNFELSSGITFKPSTMFRYITASPISVDVTAAFNFNNKIEIGPSYRFQEGFGGLFIFGAANWMDVGYAYEAAFDNEITAQSQGTHEVFLKLKM